MHLSHWVSSWSCSATILDLFMESVVVSLGVFDMLLGAVLLWNRVDADPNDLFLLSFLLLISISVRACDSIGIEGPKVWPQGEQSIHLDVRLTVGVFHLLLRCIKSRGARPYYLLDWFFWYVLHLGAHCFLADANAPLANIIESDALSFLQF